MKTVVILVGFCLTHHHCVPVFCAGNGKEMIIFLFLMTGSQLF